MYCVISSTEDFLREEGVVIHERRNHVFLCDEIADPSRYASIIKYGRVYDSLAECPLDKNLLGVSDKARGVEIKREFDEIRRFKHVPLIHTDKDVKEQGIELIDCGQGRVAKILWYQNIPLYESIDFDKPFRDMNMGMMPAKLAHFLVHCAANLAHQNGVETPTLYDPFVGSATLGCVANAMGYGFLGSDRQHIRDAQRNLDRRKTTPYFHDRPFVIWTHDVMDESNKSMAKYTNAIVSEGRLGPIITQYSSLAKIDRSRRDVADFTKEWLTVFARNHPGVPFVFCLPYYIALSDDNLRFWRECLDEVLSSYRFVSHIYRRSKQSVGRMIVVGTL